MELEDLSPIDVRWEVIKNVYDKEVTKDLKLKLIGSPAAVIMMFCMSFVPALAFDSDEELLEVQNRLYKHHAEVNHIGELIK